VRAAGVFVVSLVFAAVLFGVLLPHVLEAPTGGRGQLARSSAEELVNAVNLFRMDHGKLPGSLDDLLHPPHEDGGARAYVNRRDNFLDPWKRPFAYRVVEGGRFEISSLGRDGAAGGAGEDADVTIGAP
jgi:general secretion pathway protein G